MREIRRFWVARLSRRAATLTTAAFGLLVLAAAGVVAQAALSPAALVGKWQGVERTGPIAIAGQVLFFQNGAYQRYHVAGALQAIDTGSFQVAQNWIHFYVTDCCDPTRSSKLSQSLGLSLAQRRRRSNGRSA